MKEFESYKEFLNSSDNSASENTLYVGKNWREVHRVNGRDCTRKKMAAMIYNLNLKDFLLSVDNDRESYILNLFSKYGYVPVGVYAEETCKDYLFCKA